MRPTLHYSEIDYALDVKMNNAYIINMNRRIDEGTEKAPKNRT